MKRVINLMIMKTLLIFKISEKWHFIDNKVFKHLLTSFAFYPFSSFTFFHSIIIEHTKMIEHSHLSYDKNNTY